MLILKGVQPFSKQKRGREDRIGGGDRAGGEGEKLEGERERGCSQAVKINMFFKRVQIEH